MFFRTSCIPTYGHPLGVVFPRPTDPRFTWSVGTHQPASRRQLKRTGETGILRRGGSLNISTYAVTE